MVEQEEEEDRDHPWNFHTCKTCHYRSKSAFVMCKHVEFHERKSKTDTFSCGSNTPEMWECEFCEYKTNWKVDLCEHFRVFHAGKQFNNEQENILRVFSCKNCHFKTYSVLVLTRHTDDCNAVNNLHQENESGGNILVQVDEEDTSWFEDSSSQSSAGSVAVLHKERNHKQYSGNIKRTVGKVIIEDHNVEIILSSPVHFGIYHVTLFCGVSNNSTIIQMGYLRAENLVDHECFPAKTGHIAADSARDEKSFLCAFNMCCPKSATLRGKETFINSVGKFVTIFMATASIERLQNGMKHHRCCFCFQLVTSIGHHLQTTHGNEPLIATIMRLPHGNRLKELRKLRLLGDKNQQISQNVDCPKCKASVEIQKFHEHKVECVGKETALKRHCCYYCSKLVTCIGRHLQGQHKHEPEMRRILTLPPSAKVKELRKLRLQGDKVYNEKVKLDKRIPVRKPVSQQVSESVVCPKCSGLIARKNLYRHRQRCCSIP